MQYRKTLLLLLLTLITLGLIIILERPQREKDANPALILDLLGPDFGPIHTLEIHGRGLPTKRVLTLTEGTWSIQSPIQWPANTFAVERILAQLLFLRKDVGFSVEEIQQSGQTLSDYGLGEPHLVLTLSSKEGKKELWLGQPINFYDRLYLLTPDRQFIWLVNKELIESLGVDLESLRRQELFNLPVFEISGIKIRTEAASDATLIEKKPEGWYLESPLKVRADTAQVEELIEGVLNLKAHSFVNAAQPLADYGLEHPKLQLSLYGNKRQEVLLVGHMTPADHGPQCCFAKLKDHPAVFTITQASLSALPLAQEQLRECKLLTINTAAFKEMQIQDKAGKTVTLQKLENGLWQVLENDADGALKINQAEEEAIAALIEKLSHLEARRFVSETPSVTDRELWGLLEPQWKVTVMGPETQTFYFGQVDPATQLVYSCLEGSPSIYAVDQAILPCLSTSLFYYRNRVVYKLPAAAYVRSFKLVDLEHATSGLEQSFNPTKSKERPKGEEAAAHNPEQQAAAVLLAYLQAFRVKAYLAEPFAPPYPLPSEPRQPWKYLLEAEVVLPGAEGTASQTLLYYFTAPLSDTFQIGASPSLHSVFTLEQAFIDALRAAI